jgi:hypothetical protein
MHFLLEHLNLVLWLVLVGTIAVTIVICRWLAS